MLLDIPRFLINDHIAISDRYSRSNLCKLIVPPLWVCLSPPTNWGYCIPPIRSLASLNPKDSSGTKRFIFLQCFFFLGGATWVRRRTRRKMAIIRLRLSSPSDSGISTPSAAAASPIGAVGVSATLYGTWDKEVAVMRPTEVNLRRI